MKKLISVVTLYTFLISQIAVAGKIQQQDIKTAAQCTSAGASIGNCLPLDSQIYVTANGINKQLSSAIASGQIGGGGGSKNYLTAYTASTSGGTANAGNGDAELGSTTGWSLAHSAISTANGYPLPTSTATAGSAFSASSGGSAASSNLSLTASTSSPLQKSYSFLLASSAASTAGDMLISSAFNIDSVDQAKMLTITADYSVVSGTLNMSGSSSNSFAWYVYDVTNGAWIQPAGVYNLTQSSGNAKSTQVTFQSTSNSTQYQLALVNINATSGSYSLKLDELSVGPQTAPSGPAVSDWFSFTPSGSWTSNAAYTGKYRRVGDSLEFQETVTLSGAPNSTALILNLPSGLTIDTTKLNSTSATSYPALGKGAGIHSGISNVLWGLYNSTSSISIGYQSSTSASETSVNATVPVSWASGDVITFNSSMIPIVGWSSNSSVSSDTDTRIIAATASISTNTSPGAAGIIIAPNVAFDTAGAYNSSTGVYVVPVTGYYQVSAIAYTSGTNTNVTLYKNGSSYQVLFATGTASNATSGAITVKANSGDTLSLVTSAAATFTGFSSSFQRLTGPAVVSATESVNARYYGNSGQTIPNGSLVGVVYPNKSFDSHSAMNTSTGLYTIPVSGKYRVTGAVSSSSSTSGAIGATIYHNGSQYSQIYGSPSSAGIAAIVSDSVQCLAGDTINIEAYNATGSSVTLSTSNTGSLFFAIERIGN